MKVYSKQKNTPPAKTRSVFYRQLIIVLRISSTPLKIKGVGVLRSFAVRVLKGKGAFGKKLFPLNMKIIIKYIRKAIS